MSHRKRRAKHTFDFDSNELRRLYWETGHNIRQIAKETSLPRRLVLDELRKLGPLRNPRAQRKYWRGQFSGNALEEAYLLGLRAGDINAVRLSEETVVARVSSTHTALLELFTKSFARYGPCTQTARRVFLTGYDWQIRVSLDQSFSFLIEKPTTTIDLEQHQLYSFIAGVSDSDGTWAITRDNLKTACGFILSSENKSLLDDLKQKLRKNCFHASVYLDKPKGTTKILSGVTGDKEIRLTMDMWRLEIHRREEVRALARQVLPFSLHREKIRKMCLILDEKNEEWSSMAPKIEELRHDIEQDTKNCISRAEIEYKARHPGSANEAGSSARPTLNSIQLGASLV
jgi:hypothetical protein